LRAAVDKIVKLLKQKAFIIEKFLDTAFRRPIRFRQKVLMVFSELRWNYSPLKEKAVLLPDGLFVSLCREATLRSTPLRILLFISRILLLMRAARRASRPRGDLLCDKICRYAALRSTPLRFLRVHSRILLLMRAARRVVGLAAISFATKFVATLRFAPHRYGFFAFIRRILLLMRAARRASRPRGRFFCCSAPHR
jgi:hypothetical protein